MGNKQGLRGPFKGRVFVAQRGGTTNKNNIQSGDRFSMVTSGPARGTWDASRAEQPNERATCTGRKEKDLAVKDSHPQASWISLGLSEGGRASPRHIAVELVVWGSRGEQEMLKRALAKKPPFSFALL